MTQLREWGGPAGAPVRDQPRVIPPCWEKHNGMVEALFALKDHERVCNTETATPTAAVDWFPAFREIKTRLIGPAASTHCTRQEHRSARVQDWASNEGV